MLVALDPGDDGTYVYVLYTGAALVGVAALVVGVYLMTVGIRRARARRAEERALKAEQAKVHIPLHSCFHGHRDNIKFLCRTKYSESKPRREQQSWPGARRQRHRRPSARPSRQKSRPNSPGNISSRLLLKLIASMLDIQVQAYELGAAAGSVGT